MSILIKNCTILQATETSDTPIVADLLIDGNKISEVGNAASGSAARCDEVIDGRDLLVTPGFIDADMHSSEFLLRGEYENQPYEFRSQLSKTPGLLESITPHDRYHMARLAGSIALKQGVTAIQDHCILLEKNCQEQIQAILKAYGELGLRTTLAIEIMPEGLTSSLFPSKPSSPLSILEVSKVVQRVCQVCDELIHQFHGSEGGRGQLSIVPNDQLLFDANYQDWLRSLADNRQVRLHYHLHPALSEVNQFENRTGLTPFQLLRQSNLLNENLVASHGIWLSPEEIDAFSNLHCHLVHTPVSDLYLGSGFAGLTTYLKAGAPVALGTGIGGNFKFTDVLKLTASIHRIAQPDFNQWPSISTVFSIGIQGGAKALQLPNKCGSIEPGACADLVMYDLNSLALAPLNAAKSQLVCLEAGQSIQHVMVDGKFLLRNGRPCHFSQGELYAQANELVLSKDMLRTILQHEVSTLEAHTKELSAQYSQANEPYSRWTDRPANPSQLKKL